ncbi:MAG: RDD family protein [Caulobacteraceae bacterium]
MSLPSAASSSKRPASEVRAPLGGRVRELVTPEGVDLQLRLGEASERALAFMIDGGVIIGVLVGATVALLLTASAIRAPFVPQAMAIVWILGFFLLRNFYFIGFELGGRAATPGKRLVGLRVASRNGGPLTADAIFARNALREIEFYLPVSFLLTNRAMGISGLTVAAGLIWSGVFLLFPLFNRDRLRAGDLAAGTWVVRAPRRRLGTELAQRAEADRRFTFTTAQLDAYGEAELQVLEDVLRYSNRKVMADVAARIRRKIDWVSAPDERDGAFLDAYYAALRARLETGMLFGRRRKDKHDRQA